jgi:hypothetical protein
MKYQFIGTQSLKAHTIVKCYKVIPGNNITIEPDPPSTQEFAHTDLNNVTAPTQAFKELVMLWCIPDYKSAANITQPQKPSNKLQTYNAPCHGFFCYDVLGFNNSYAQIIVNGVDIFKNTTVNNTVYWNINRNDTYSIR